MIQAHILENPCFFWKFPTEEHRCIHTKTINVTAGDQCIGHCLGVFDKSQGFWRAGLTALEVDFFVLMVYMYFVPKKNTLCSQKGLVQQEFQGTSLLKGFGSSGWCKKYYLQLQFNDFLNFIPPVKPITSKAVSRQPIMVQTRNEGDI